MRTLARLSLSPLLLAASVSVVAQPAPLPAAAIEESTTQSTPAALRAEIRTLERNMFELFNELNSNDEFDVNCGYHTPTGSKIPLWKCDPAFMRVAESAEFMQMKDSRAPNAAGLTGIGYVPQDRDDLAYMLREKTAEMQSEMKALAFAHPELAQAVMALHERRQQLAAIEAAAE
ncbi:MAG TPA: hypothetical protein VGE69_03800 [Pseudomonadales bacterium]